MTSRLNAINAAMIAVIVGAALFVQASGMTPQPEVLAVLP